MKRTGWAVPGALCCPAGRAGDAGKVHRNPSLVPRAPDIPLAGKMSDLLTASAPQRSPCFCLANRYILYFISYFMASFSDRTLLIYRPQFIHYFKNLWKTRSKIKFITRDFELGRFNAILRVLDIKNGSKLK